MTTTIWVGVYGLLIGFGAGQRVALYYMRKEAKRVAERIAAMTQEMDRQEDAAHLAQIQATLKATH